MKVEILYCKSKYHVVNVIYYDDIVTHSQLQKVVVHTTILQPSQAQKCTIHITHNLTGGMPVFIHVALQLTK